MLTACSQDQYTIYKGSFLTNLLCCWCDGVALRSLNKFTFTYLFRHVHHSQRCTQLVSHCHPFPSSPITLADTMANTWLQVPDAGLPFAIPVGKVDIGKICSRRCDKHLLCWSNEGFKLKQVLSSVIL